MWRGTTKKKNSKRSCTKLFSGLLFLTLFCCCCKVWKIAKWIGEIRKPLLHLLLPFTGYTKKKTLAIRRDRREAQQKKYIKKKLFSLFESLRQPATHVARTKLLLLILLLLLLLLVLRLWLWLSMMMRLQMQLDATCRPLHARPRPRLSLDTSDKSQRAQLQPLYAATATAMATANCDCYGHCYCYSVTATATATTTATTTTDNIKETTTPDSLGCTALTDNESESETLT